jgi:hypothetical protein
MSDDLDVDGQPNGVRVEQTLDVIDKVLSDPAFAVEVATHNEWDIPSEEQFQPAVALRFLTARYQSATTLLSLQTSTLKDEVAGLQREVEDLRWLLQGLQDQVMDLQAGRE